MSQLRDPIPNQDEPLKGEDLGYPENGSAETNGNGSFDNGVITNFKGLDVVYDDSSAEIEETRGRLEAIQHTPREAILDLLMEIAEPAGDVDPLTRRGVLEKLWESLDSEKRLAFERLAELADKKYEIREQIRVSKKVFDRTVEATRNIIDATSGWTADHSTRLTILAYKMADEMWEFPDWFMEGTWQGGLLHDLGKIGVPKSILEKPSFLDPSTEKPIMDSHAWLGNEILERNFARNLSYINDSTYHHETWSRDNHKGYSYGRHEAEIPVMSQILAVTDVMDALLSFRPYKQGKTPEGSIRIIESMAEEGHFSPWAAAQLISMYEGGRVSFSQYFRPKEDEERIVEMLRSRDEFSRARNSDKLSSDQEKLRTILKGESRNGSLPLAELAWEVQQVTPQVLEAVQQQLEREISELEVKRAEKRQVNIDALFLMVTSVEARHLAYQSKENTQKLLDENGKIDPERLKEDMNDRLAEVRKRTQNRVRYALMLAQQMEMSLEEQQQVIMAAMFAPMGILGVDEKKVIKKKVVNGKETLLGITDYDEFKKVPQIGYDLLRDFMDDPDIAPFFKGADLGPADAYKWWNGEGYGVKTNGTDQPSRIGHVASIALKYVAMISPNAHREKGIEPDDAMVELRKSVGTEFDPAVFAKWEELYAQFRLNVVRERPEIVEQSKAILAGEALDLNPRGPFGKKISTIVSEIHGNSRDQGLARMMVGIELSAEAGRFEQMERFLAMAEELIIEKRDIEAIRRIQSLYQYDVDKVAAEKLSIIHERIGSVSAMEDPIGRISMVTKAIGAFESMVTDYAEMFKAVDSDTANSIREAIMPLYRQAADDLLAVYMAKILEGDGEAQLSLEPMLDRAVMEIGDAAFAEKVEKTKKEAEFQKQITRLDRYLVAITQDIQTGRSQNPMEAEHSLAMAQLIVNELEATGHEVNMVRQRVESAGKSMYAAGYMPLFRHAQRLADQGEVGLVEVLSDKARHWMNGADKIIPISDDDFVALGMKARKNGILKFQKLLESGNLGLEEIPLVKRWVNNINLWQQELPEVVIDPVMVRALEFQANHVIRERLNEEVEATIESGSEVELKRLIILLKDYVIDSSNSELLDDEVRELYDRAAKRLIDVFEYETDALAEKGKEEQVIQAVYFFNKFCSDTERYRNREGEWVEKQILRIELTEDEKARLDGLVTKAYSVSLDRRIEAIRDEGGAIDAERIMSEVNDMGEVWRKFEEKSAEGINEEYYTHNLNEAVVNAYSQKIERAVAMQDHQSLVEAFNDLLRLINKEFDYSTPFNLHLEQASIDRWRMLAEDLVIKAGNHFAENGDVEHFEMAKVALGSLGIGVDLGSLEEQAISNCIQRAYLRMQLEGAQSAVGNLRKVQDDLQAVLARYPQYDFDLSELDSFAGFTVSKVVDKYKLYLKSVMEMGSLMSFSWENTKEDAKRAIMALEATTLGQEDAKELRGVIEATL